MSDKFRGTVEITQRSLAQDVFREINNRSASPIPMLSKSQQEALMSTFLSSWPPDAECWIFGYGSLLWNPGFEVAERRIGAVYGYHRRFCVWTRLGRGTPEQPGLLMGLDQGGSCRGMALRFSKRSWRQDIANLWRREMNTTAYDARKAKVHTGDGSLQSLVFVANRQSDHYAGRLPSDQCAYHIGHAKGYLGTCRDYFDAAQQRLVEIGIEDRHIDAIGCSLPDS